MSKKTTGKIKTNFSFLYNVLYPACALFAVIVLGAFTVLHFLGYNVTESWDMFTQKYDGELDDVTSEWLIGKEYSFSIGMLIGLFLFCIAFFALSYIFRMGFDRLSARLLHFFGTFLAFFLFFLVFSGYITDTASTFGTIMLSLTLVAIVYFICLGFKMLLKRPIAFLTGKAGCIIKRYIAPAIAIFAFSVIICAILAMFLKVNVKINEVEDWDPDAARSKYESYETIITPLAPTLQNYLRYLGSAGIIILGLAVFATKLPKVAKGTLNFLICTCGFVCLWFIQLDFFHELDNMRLISVIVYLSAYLVIFITAAIILFIIKRKRESSKDYDGQFTVKKRKKTNIHSKNISE